jgi:hypothetical protein
MLGGVCKNDQTSGGISEVSPYIYDYHFKYLFRSLKNISTKLHYQSLASSYKTEVDDFC